jgi:hypothetical protein
LHNGIDGSVIEGLGLILQDEIDGVGFLASGEVLTFVDIEEAYFLQQLALGLVGNSLNLGKPHTLVHQQC